jgi:Family of unknown function (DUF6516)
MTERDSGAEGWDYFLDLHLYKIGYENGYWVTIRVTKVEPDEGRPHGLQYALSLHDENDDRVLGYDNAHPVDVATGPAQKSKRPKAHDHIDRRGGRRKPYKFTTPFKLLEDFFADVDEILKKEGVS